MNMEQASHIFWRIAQQVLAEMQTHAGEEKQLREYRKVAGQLLFYTGISAIEEVLAKKVSAYAVGNHQKRGELLSKHVMLFGKYGEKILRYYRILTEHETDYRRKVAYRGEDGSKFALLKEFAQICVEANDNA